MDVREAVMTRRSIRAFAPDPVPRELQDDILHKALWAPSWGNTQTWGLTIVTGEALDRIKEENAERMRNGVPPKPDLVMPTTWDEKEGGRYREIGKTLFDAMGIQREDQEKRAAYYIEMARSFGAPHIVYLHLRKDFNSYALMDSGILPQTIALLAVERGLGTCFLAVSVLHPDVIRAHAAIPSDRVIVMGMAIGYPRLNDPVNLFDRRRGVVEDFVKWASSDLIAQPRQGRSAGIRRVLRLHRRDG
jgi:nitroreductase